jgi:hypothetical protein
MKPRGVTREAYFRPAPLPLFDSPIAAHADGQPSAPKRTPRFLTPRERRDRGLSRAVAASPFLAEANRVLPSVLRPGERLLAEDVRVRLETRGVRPRSPKAWGALISQLVKRGTLRETGAWLPMQLNRGGSRRTPEYEVTAVLP